MKAIALVWSCVALVGCGQPAPQSEFQALVTRGAPALAGTYDSRTGDTWLISSVVSQAEALARAQQVADFSIVFMVDATSYPYRLDPGEAVLPPGVNGARQVRACVVDQVDGRRFTLARFDLHGSDEGLATFAPTELLSESPLCPPNCLCGEGDNVYCW